MPSPWPEAAVDVLVKRIAARRASLDKVDVIRSDWSLSDVRADCRKQARRDLDALAPYVPQSSEKQQVAEGHRVEITFDGDVTYPRLIHPEAGCSHPTDPDTGEEMTDDPCWITDWIEEHGIDLLHGKVTLAVTEEWDGDCARLHVNDNQFGPTQQQSPEPDTGLGVEDREAGVWTVIGDLQRTAEELRGKAGAEHTADAYEDFSSQLVAAMSSAEPPSGGREQRRVGGHVTRVMSAACTRGDHGHCVFWVCGGRCACNCHQSAALSDHQGTGGADA
jgi:hypothetical protein